jgi:hypothetical protein
MMARCFCIALLVVATLATAAGEPGWVSDSGLFRVSFRSELDPIVINRIHSWVLHVEDEHGAPVASATITVTGGMPSHNHGLPTAPRVTQELTTGEYVLEGMRFHMRGQWIIEITINANDEQDVVVIPLEL